MYRVEGCLLALQGLDLAAGVGALLRGAPVLQRASVGQHRMLISLLILVVVIIVLVLVLVLVLVIITASLGTPASLAAGVLPAGRRNAVIEGVVLVGFDGP